MKKLFILFLFLPLFTNAQSIVDSVTFRFSQGDIKYYIVRDRATAANSDSLMVIHNGVRTSLSPMQLPISILQQSALDAKQATITNGLLSGTSAVASATTGVQSVSMVTPIVTITPTGACTFNASGGITGQRVTFIVTTSGVTSFVLTFGTNFRTVGTLATGTTTARKFCVSFIYDGSQWIETGRTTSII